MSGKRNKYLGSNCKPVAKAGVAPKSNNPELSKNHSKESTMTVENTIVAEETIETTTTTTVAEKAPMSEEVKSAIRGNVASKVSGYNWDTVLGSGVISAVGTAASMVISNKLQEKFLPEETEARYSALEITGVTIAAGLVGAGLQAGLQCIDAVNNSEQNRLVAGSVIANGVVVGGVFARDPILALVRGKIGASTEDYVTAEESAEA